MFQACFCWRLVYRTCVFVFFWPMGGGGLGWGGLITFNGTSTHTWCYASDLVSCTCTHTWCYTTDLVSCTCTHTNGNGAGKTVPVHACANLSRLTAKTLRANMQWKCCARKKNEKSDFFVLSLWRNANPSKNKASWNSLFLRLVFTKACKYKWKMMKNKTQWN